MQLLLYLKINAFKSLFRDCSSGGLLEDVDLGEAHRGRLSVEIVDADLSELIGRSESILVFASYLHKPVR